MRNFWNIEVAVCKVEMSSKPYYLLECNNRGILPKINYSCTYELNEWNVRGFDFMHSRKIQRKANYYVHSNPTLLEYFKP